MINEKYGETFFVFPFHSKIDIWKMKTKIKKVKSKVLVDS